MLVFLLQFKSFPLTRENSVSEATAPWWKAAGQGLATRGTGMVTIRRSGLEVRRVIAGWSEYG